MTIDSDIGMHKISRAQRDTHRASGEREARERATTSELRPPASAQMHGEGDTEAARLYNERAQSFAASGVVEPAARYAAQERDRDPGSHEAAEAQGKARAREFDPAVSDPTWFEENHRESFWTRIAHALHRDWQQTLHDINPRAGEELEQSFVDTLRQMAGSQPPPIAGEPTSVHHETEAENRQRAMHFGYQAAGHFPGPWSPQVETMLEEEWRRTYAGDYPRYRPYIYMGWRSFTNNT